MRLDNVPDLADITTMTNLLAHLGVEVTTRQSLKGRSIIFSAKGLTDTTAPYDLVRKMRASVLVLGPLMARHGQAKVSLPGGCAIGTRPVDLHIKGLQQMGAEIELDSGYIVAKAPNGLKGGEVTFPKVSVGATENLLMAATLAKGETHPDQRRARAGNCRSRAVPEGDGRQDRGHRYRPSGHPGRRAAAWLHP